MNELSHFARLQAQFSDGQAKVAIVGLGYVGLPLLLRCAESGLSVTGIDVDAEKIDALQAGRSYIRHIDDARIAALLESDCRLTTSIATVADVDAVIVCVPTPLNRHREPDLGFVVQTFDDLAPHLSPGVLVALESTTYPGTTEEEVIPRVTAHGLTLGETVFVAYSPEREDPGNPNFETRTIPKIVSGASQSCLELAQQLYGRIVDTVVPVSSMKAAELTKLMENIHRAVNIGLVNEMKMAADAMDIDIHEVIDAAASKPFGFVPYKPGPGIGGHCIPIDPFYLTWKAREFGVHTRFIELAGEINSAMPGWVLDKVTQALNLQGKSVAGARVLVLGVAYKKNIDDLRHSPSLELLERLNKLGAELAYADPHVPVFPRLRDHDFSLRSQELTEAMLAEVDCAVLMTDHDSFDYALLQRCCRKIVDTRGRLDRSRDNVIPA